MTPIPSFRDIEKLSAYLDGELKPSEIAALESRLATSPDLREAMTELRQARNVLGQLPQRRAPRNFTLTPKMVGLKPPLPRTYPVFRFASVVATLLLFLSFATNFIAPRITTQMASAPYGIGGRGASEFEAEEPAMALEAPAEPAEPVESAESAEPAAPAEPIEEAPDVVEEPAPLEVVPELEALPTPTPPAEGDSFRVQPTGIPTQVAQDQVQEKAGIEERPTVGEETNEVVPESVIPEQKAKPIPLSWQIALAALALLNGLILLFLRWNAASRWRKSK
jgi:hypothetical protein